MGIEITCKKAVDYISRKEEGKLSLWQRIQLWRHTTVCSLCSRFMSQNTLFTSLDGHSHHLSATHKNEIKDAVLNEINRH